LGGKTRKKLLTLKTKWESTCHQLGREKMDVGEHGNGKHTKKGLTENAEGQNYEGVCSRAVLRLKKKVKKKKRKGEKFGKKRCCKRDRMKGVEKDREKL